MRNRPLLSLCLVIVAAVVLSVLYGGEKFVRELRPSPLEENVPLGGSVTIRGQIYRLEAKSDYQVLYLCNNSIRYQEHTFQESKIILYTDSEEQFHMGNIVEAGGEVSFFQNARNPGNFDQKRYYQIQDIHGMVWGEEISIADRGVWKWRDRLVKFRRNWAAALTDAMGAEDGTVMSAMILGEKSGMDQEVKMLYQANGIGHILAISGLHLSFVGIGMYKILRRLTGSYPIGGAFGILFLALYILMIGLTVSAVRALTMFLFRVGADMTGRHYDAPTAFSVAAVVVLVWRPLSLYDGGFWLSFGAVFAVLAVVPVVQESIPKGTLYCTKTIRPKRIHYGVSLGIPKGTFVQASYNGNVLDGKLARTMSARKVHAQSSPKQNTEDSILSVYLLGAWKHVWKMILQGLTAGIGINLVILPILLYYFFEFPLYSFVLNLFVIPLMSVLLFLGMAGSLLALWFVPVSALLFRICGKILWIYKMSCETALQLPGARIVIGRPDMWQIGVYYGILFLGLILLRYVLFLKEREENETKAGGSIGVRKSARVDASGRKRWFVLFLWAVGIMILTVRFGESGKLTTIVLDVGQGDGIFMKGPEGGTYLVDGGSSDVKKVGQYRLESFLKSQGVRTLDYVLISHGDSDHINGVEELIERQEIGVEIGTLVLPVQEVWDEALAGLAEKAKAYGVRVVVMESGQSVREGNMEITCIQPGNPGTEAENMESEIREPEVRAAEGGYESGNAASMVLAVKFGEFDMLLTGDVEGRGEEQLTEQLEEQYRGCTWEVLKVAHHGSKNSSSEEFLRQVRPAYAFISAGRENRYGHPHQETIVRLADVGSKICSTQENGALIVEVGGGDTMRVGSYCSRSEQ